MNYPTDITCADLEAIFTPVAFVKLEAEAWAIENEDLLAEIAMEATGVGDGVR